MQKEHSAKWKSYKRLPLSIPHSLPQDEWKLTCNCGILEKRCHPFAYDETGPKPPPFHIKTAWQEREMTQGFPCCSLSTAQHFGSPYTGQPIRLIQIDKEIITSPCCLRYVGLHGGAWTSLPRLSRRGRQLWNERCGLVDLHRSLVLHRQQTRKGVQTAIPWHSQCTF